MRWADSSSAYEPAVASLAHSRFFAATSGRAYDLQSTDDEVHKEHRPEEGMVQGVIGPGDDTMAGGNVSALRSWSLADTTSYCLVTTRAWPSVLHRRPLSGRDRGLMDLEQQLNDYANLEPDWDGYEGIAPPPAAIAAAVRFLRLLDHDVPLPFPQVSGDGSIGIYWEGTDFLIDVGFRGLGQISYFARLGDRRWKGDDPFRGSDIPKRLFEAISAILRR